jgi:iron complex transport system ATP-binding protein
VTVLEAAAVTVTIRGRNVLEGFSLCVEAGEVVALLGPNGAGKTTLLRCILGLIRPTQGVVTLQGIDSLAYSAKQRAGLVGYLAQQATNDDALTVIEYVAAARFRHDESRSANQRAARAALARVDAEDLAERRLGPLSGGERQRVALAALLAQEAATLLLDEPANHLDPARQAQSYALLGQLQQGGSTMLIVTHDVNLLAHLSCPERVRVVGLQQGRNTFDLAYADPRLCDQLTELYGVPMQRFVEHGQALIVPAMTRLP